MSLLNINKTKDTDKENTCVVRLETSSWVTIRGVHLRKSLIYLKSKSYGYNILDEDCSAIGIEEVTSKIVNLYTVPDGIYKVEICGEIMNWETNTIDDYDYKLIEMSPKDKGKDNEI